MLLVKFPILHDRTGMRLIFDLYLEIMLSDFDNINFMSISRSQQYYYFQNKAYHYENIKNMKSVIDDRLDRSISNLVNKQKSPMRKKQTHLQKYEIDKQNELLLNRLYGIMKSKTTQVSRTGSYSRSNSISRNFRKINPYKHEEHRLIEQENRKITHKLQHTKPLVGSIDRWKQDYGQYITHRQNLSRYDREDQLKSPLQLEVSKFIPKPYRTILHTEQSQQPSKNRKITLNNLKLLELPAIKSKMQINLKNANSSNK